MTEIRHESSCEAPVEVAFAYVDDHRNATDWMFGLTRFVPVGELDHGLGAVFDGAFAVPPVKLSARIEVTEYRRDEVIAFRSVSGFSNWSHWTFRPASPTRTTVSVVFGYELPGGLAGRALGKALEPVVALSVRRSDSALRHQIEQQWARTRNA